jgi:hypothetical protein
VGVDHDADVGSEGLAHLADPRRRVVDALVLQPHPQLHRAVATLHVLGHLLADGADRGPPAARVGGDALAVLSSQEPPHRLTERAAEQVPARDVDAADRAEREPATAHGGKGPALAGRIVGAGAVVERLPDPGDVSRVAADQDRRHLLTDQRDHRRVVAEIAHRGLGLAEADEPDVGLDLDQAHVEGVVAAEVAHVGVLGGNGRAEPGGSDGGDLHGGASVRRDPR